LLVRGVHRLGQAGNTLLDRSGYGNHGTLTNMDAGTDWVGSRYGWALDFDGSNDFVSIADNDTLDIASPMSFCLWVNGTSTANRVLMEKGSNGSLVLQPNGDNQLYFYSGVTVASITGISSSIFNGSWNFLSVTYDGTNATIYSNGVALAIRAATAVTANASPLVIGGRNGGTHGVLCQVDDIRVYRRLLTLTEIRLLGTEPGIGLKPERTSVFFGAQLFNAAWAKNSNQLISAGVI
jgi:hypothetical protein